MRPKNATELLLANLSVMMRERGGDVEPSRKSKKGIKESQRSGFTNPIFWNPGLPVFSYHSTGSRQGVAKKDTEKRMP